MSKQVVVLRLSRLSIPKKIAKARFIVISMAGNVNFVTPNPTLATITTNTNALETASIAAAGGGVDETANMRAKEVILDLSLDSLGAYVEGLANANPINAEAIILSAGMDVKGHPIHVAREFHVEGTGNPGEVRLATKHARYATFIFQMTTDPNNANSWIVIAQSTRAKFLKTGLLSGTRYHFRTAVVDKHGQGPWSNVLNIIAA